MKIDDLKIAIIGLGYAGLPLAVEFGKKISTLGFDIKHARITELKSGDDHTLEVSVKEQNEAKIGGEDVFINGDGETSRDFCYIANTVQANILAATTQDDDAKNQVYNVAVGDRTTLNQLFAAIKSALKDNRVSYDKSSVYRDFRPGDVRHSQADVSKITTKLGYEPTHSITQGIGLATPWYKQNLAK